MNAIHAGIRYEGLPGIAQPCLNAVMRFMRYGHLIRIAPKGAHSNLVPVRRRRQLGLLGNHLPLSHNRSDGSPRKTSKMF